MYLFDFEYFYRYFVHLGHNFESIPQSYQGVLTIQA